MERYVILERIAKGGMGAIYRAMDKRLGDRIVAIKEMAESAIAPAERKQVIESFQREAELLATLQHPNLIHVTDTFQVQDSHYMVMEYIPGKTLQTLLDEQTKPFAEDQVLLWAEQLCGVLAYLHAQTPPIIYRDMKPSNVMIVEDSDEVKLIDFGIARFFKPGKRKDTIQFGTDGYAPPEQYGKMQTDERSDVYALGAMLHQLLTLRDPQTVLFQFPSVKSLNAQASSRVSNAIAKAVQPNKDKRHQNIPDLWKDLTGDKAAELMIPQQSALLPQPSLDIASAPEGGISGPLLDIGRITMGLNAPYGSLRIPVAAGEVARVVSEVPWLRLTESTVDPARQEVGIALYTAALKTPRLRLQGNLLKRWLDVHTRFLVPTDQTLFGRVRVERSNGATETIPVTLAVAPPGWQLAGGWTITIGLMLTELGGVMGILLAMLAAFF